MKETSLNIYHVANSFHLKEGLDSEFLVIAEDEEGAKQECLRMLTEDQDSHIASVEEDIANLRRGMEKYGQLQHSDDPADQFMARALERNKETIVRLTTLLQRFDGYKAQYLTVRRINPRLKNGQVQYD